MKQRFKLFRRGNNRFYAEDTTTGKQSSLGTTDKAEANRLLYAKNEAAYQPAFKKQMAKPISRQAIPAPTRAPGRML